MIKQALMTADMLLLGLPQIFQIEALWLRQSE